MKQFLMAIVIVIWSITISSAVELERIGNGPLYSDIKDRQVYAKAVYDFKFRGNSKAQRRRTAQRFINRLVSSRFQNKEGNYVLTLEIVKNNKIVIREPILSLKWKNNRFLFLNVSSETTFDTRSAGVLMADFPVDDQNNEFDIKISLLKSDNSAIDLSILKELSRLAKVSAVSQFAPGISTISEAYKPFESILEKLLSQHEKREVTTQTTAAFTLLNDSQFGNQYAFESDGFRVNIFFHTYNTQMDGHFQGEGNGFTRNFEPSDVLETLRAGFGTARKPIMDVMIEDKSDLGKRVSNGFLQKISSGSAVTDKDVRSLCRDLRRLLVQYLTIRDAPLAYWAIMHSYSYEISTSRNGEKCISGAKSYLERYNLDIDISSWKDGVV